MSLRVLDKAAQLEQDPELHMARILILLNARSSKKPIEGITKLAKLDFLLRYPVGLERALTRTKGKELDLDIKNFERRSVESRMIRFKYGPWDGRYRQWIGLLVAKGLVSTYLSRRTVMLELTDAGQEIAEKLSSLEEFHDISMRSSIIQKRFGNMSGTKIKDFVYETFPELNQMKWGEEIEI